MKKIISILTLISLLGFAGLVSAKVDRVTDDSWDLIGTYTIEFACVSGCSGTWPHTMNITSMDVDTGDFSGTGYYNNNTAITWTVDGNVDGSNVSFRIDYDGSSYYVEATGTIDSDGELSGNANSSSQTFTWETTSGTASQEEYKNHGQYVKSQDNKKEAAHSRIGMPVQSKGHTK